MRISCGLNRFTLRLLQVSLPSLLILTLLMFALTPVSRGAHPMNLTTPSGNNETAHNVGMTGGPSLLSEEDSTRAIAFDTIIWQREPFSLTSPSALGQNQRTRVMLFATNLHLMPGETISALMAEAEDGTQALFPLTVEDIVKVPDFEWLSGVVVRLNDDLGVGDVLIRIYYNGIASNRVQIGIRPTPVPAYSIAANVSVVSAGNPLAVTWNIPKNQSKTDWVGLYKVGAPNTDGSELWWRYTGGARNGNLTLTAPLQGGQYEFRLFLNNSFEPAAISNPVTVKSIAPPTPTPTPKPTPTPTPVPSYYSIAASSSAVSAGGPLTVTWSIPSNQSQTDWVGLYKVGSSSANGSEQWWRYTGGSPSGNLTLNAPLQGGQYEFRLFLNNTFARVASSNSVTVASAPTPTPTPTPAPTATPTPLPTPSPTTGAQFYVSSSGSSFGDGGINNPWDMRKAMSPGIVPAGSTVYFRGGTYSLDSSSEPDTSYWEVAGTAVQPTTVRNYPGERAIIDIDYQLHLLGAHTRYIGLEFITSRTKKVFTSGWSPDRPGEFAVVGDNLKVINCVFHDMMGTSAFAEAENYEMYGNIMYYIGFIAEERSWGTTAYIQNVSGRKDITDNLMFQQFNHNLQVYGTDAARIKDIYMEGNTIFNPGSLGTNRGFNAVVWVGEQAVERIKFSDNNLYSPYEDGSNAVFWGAGGVVNLDLTITGNHIIGGAPALRLGVWNPATFTDNTISGRVGLAWYEGSLPQNRQYNWNNNKYFNQGSSPPFLFASNSYDFNGWKQATGLDTNSILTNARPTGIKVYVRPNRYEAGRAHITVINWNLADTASLDLSGSGLAVGQSFEIRDAQNYFGPPLVTGIYNGSPVTMTLPGTGSPVAPIIGASDSRNVGLVLPVHTSKEFNAFILIPR